MPAVPAMVSVVVPVYGNADTLRTLHARLTRALALVGRPYEVVFVDDACPLQSLPVLRALEQEDEHVQVVVLPANRGQHRALLAGLHRARGEQAVLMDADLQDPPEAIGPLLAALDSGASAAFAARRGHYQARGRRVTSWLFKRLVHLVCGMPVDAGLFVALDRRMIARLAACPDPDPFLPVLIAGAGLPLARIPVERAVRPCGCSAYSALKRLQTGWRALACAVRQRRASRMSGPRIAAHNLLQTQYFERTVKPTMVPQVARHTERQVDELLRFAQVGPEDRVLEVGCGMGRFTLPLARRGVRIEGLDLSPVLLERLRAYDGEGFDIPLHAGDVLDPPPELHGQFDVVLGFFVLHHLHSLPGSFEGMARLLRPGGRLVFLEPNALNVLFYIQVLITPGMSFQAESGLHRMRPGVVFPAMEAAGFRRPAVHRFGFFPPFIARTDWGARLEALLERVRLWRPLLPYQLFRGERD